MSDADRPLTNVEKIQILFKEYDTLRAEIISRTTNAVSLVAAGITLLIGIVAWFTTKGAGNQNLWVMSVLIAVEMIGFFLGFRFINVWIFRCGIRIREIERRINLLAGEETDPLLVWETRLGGTSTGKYFT